MVEGLPKLSVLVITYNQQDVIKRALDSLLRQKDYIFEICVSDDCSSDMTWNVLQQYDRDFPGLFVLNRNESNKGIFENIEKTWEMPSGDIVYYLAGDDACGDGWFKKVLEFIQKENIDWKNELFTIYGDYKCVYPNGDSMVFKQDAIRKKPLEALRLSLRGIIGGRGCCYSINVLKKFEKVSQGRSHIAETAQDRQLQLYSKINYYIESVANMYYSNIGVSTRIQDEETFIDRLEIWPYTIQYLKGKGIDLCRKDIYYGQYNIAMKQFRHKRTISNFFRLVYTFIASRDFGLPQGNGVRHLLFAIRRRLPHKMPFAGKETKWNYRLKNYIYS